MMLLRSECRDLLQQCVISAGGKEGNHMNVSSHGTETRSIATLAELDRVSLREASLNDPQYAQNGHACCDNCCDDYVCSSD